MNFPFASVRFQVAIISAFITVLKGQIVTVDVQPVSSDPVSNSATLVCNFAVDDASYSFFNLEWKFGSTLIADFFNRALVPTYYDVCNNIPGHCIATRDNSKSELHLSSLNFSRDDGTYECSVFYDTAMDTEDGQHSASLTVVVPAAPERVNMLKVGDERPLSNSSMVALSRNISEHIFTCEVQDINPAANFSWTLDGGQLPTELVSDPITGPGTGGLTTSMSNAILVADPKYNGKELKCAVVNYDGDPGIMIRVMLTVDDPCKSNPCKNGRNCTLTPDGFKCVCPLGTQEPDCDSQAPTTPESTTESSTIGSPGPSATTEVSTTGTSTTKVSSSIDPTTTGSTTWMVIGGTGQLNTSSTTPLVTTGSGPLASGSTPILTSTPTPILTTDEVDRGGSSDGLTTGQIVGICVGAGAVVAIFFVLTLCILCRESLSKRCSCLQCKSSVNPEKEGGTPDKEALELNGGSTSNKEKEEG